MFEARKLPFSLVDVLLQLVQVLFGLCGLHLGGLKVLLDLLSVVSVLNDFCFHRRMVAAELLKFLPPAGDMSPQLGEFFIESVFFRQHGFQLLGEASDGFPRLRECSFFVGDGLVEASQIEPQSAQLAFSRDQGVFSMDCSYKECAVGLQQLTLKRHKAAAPPRTV